MNSRTIPGGIEVSTWCAIRAFAFKVLDRMVMHTDDDLVLACNPKVAERLGASLEGVPVRAVANLPVQSLVCMRRAEFDRRKRPAT